MRCRERERAWQEDTDPNHRKASHNDFLAVCSIFWLDVGDSLGAAYKLDVKALACASATRDEGGMPAPAFSAPAGAIASTDASPTYRAWLEYCGPEPGSE